MSNIWGTVFYTGMTNDLERRVLEHKAGTESKFTQRYKCNRLVWHEDFNDPSTAIEMEKWVKKRRRSTKLQMISMMNPSFRDLAESLNSQLDNSISSHLNRPTGGGT